jgi:hypothetical protein
VETGGRGVERCAFSLTLDAGERFLYAVNEVDEYKACPRGARHTPLMERMER